MDMHGRNDPPKSAPPERMVGAFLDFLRETMIWKTSDLSLEQQTWAYEPSSMSLLGMIKHLAYVERSWFQTVLAGLDVEFPWTEADPDADWRIEAGEDADGIRALYRREIERSREIAAGMTWDEVGKNARAQAEGLTLGWVLTHMVEETARHCGHADLIREKLDGATGE